MTTHNDDDVYDGVRRTRRSWSAGSQQLRQRQTTRAAVTAAAAGACGGRPISVRFCESAATSHSLTSFTELDTRPSSRPTAAFDTVDTITPSVSYYMHTLLLDADAGSRSLPCCVY